MTLVRNIDLLTSRADVAGFLPAIIAAADGERESFGFLPQRAYEDFAVQRRLIVARDLNDNSLAGYIVFGGTPPQARIFQTYVSPNHRRLGVGRALVAAVIKKSESDAFLSIRVEVASDLEAANEFYRNQGFSRKRERAGGETRNRVIITRVRELDSPSLLDFALYSRGPGPAINLTLSTGTRQPQYLIDLNVLFDVTRRRGNAVGAGRVFAAALDNSVSLAVASEFVAELERNTPADRPDPILELAKALPRLKGPTPAVLSERIKQLAPLIFPDRWSAEKLSIQDRSDIAHLATAIEEGADGFITSEKAILARADWLRENVGLDVLSPEVFGKRFTSATRASSGYQVRIEGRAVVAGDPQATESAEIRSFLISHEAPDDVVRAAIAQGSSTASRRRIIIRAAGAIVAFGSWSAPVGNHRQSRLYLFVDEQDSAAELTIDHIIDAASRDVSIDAPSILQINPAASHVQTRMRCINFGFRPRKGTSTRSGKLEKLCLGAVASPASWNGIRKQVMIVAGIEMPEEAPAFRSPDDQIILKAVGGEQAITALRSLEDFISPCILALPGRAAVMVPIKARYAEALFRGSIQPSFLDDQQAAILTRRRYLGSDRTYPAVPEQGIIVFYESADGSGRSAAIAMARVTRRYLAPKGAAEGLSRERGVLSDEEVKGLAKGAEVCVTEFDNVMLFSKPVALKILKEIGCADGANMVTARQLDSAALSKLIELGVPRCALS